MCTNRTICMGSVFKLNILSIFHIFAVFAINIARISKCCSVSGEVDVDVMMMVVVDEVLVI